MKYLWNIAKSYYFMTKCPNAHTLTFNLTTEEQYTTHVSTKHVAKSIKINEMYMSLTIVVS